MFCTQVVPSESQENGQKEKEEDEDEEEEQPEMEKEKPPKKPRRESLSEVAMETQEGDTKKGIFSLFICLLLCFFCFFFVNGCSFQLLFYMCC